MRRNIEGLQHKVCAWPLGVSQPCIKVLLLGLLNEWQATVIKGNAGELGALAGSDEVGLVLNYINGYEVTFKPRRFKPAE